MTHLVDARVCWRAAVLGARREPRPPGVQEVDAFGGGSVALGDLAEGFPYVSACFREALRLYPPGHITVRPPAHASV
jgi:cytochrome P450